jgi:hypothetical protein
VSGFSRTTNSSLQYHRRRAYSRDGKRLAVARAIVTNDIVLLKGLK